MGQSRMDNPEILATLATQYTGQINVRENRWDNQEWTIQKLYCVDNVANISRLSILDCPIGFLLHLSVLCIVWPTLSISLDCSFLIVPSVFSNIYQSCVLCSHEKTDGTIKNGQSRDISNVGYTIHRTDKC
jgi:uncharacterized membrane protein